MFILKKSHIPIKQFLQKKTLCFWTGAGPLSRRRSARHRFMSRDFCCRADNGWPFKNQSVSS